MNTQCPHCQTRWQTPSSKKPELCPFCSRRLQDGAKPSFHAVWAQIKADPLHRGNQPVSDSALQDVLQEYGLAMKEDPQAFFDARSFLESLEKSGRLPDWHPQKPETMTASAKVLQEMSMPSGTISWSLQNALSHGALLQNLLSDCLHSSPSQTREAALREVEQAALNLPQTQREQFPLLAADECRTKMKQCLGAEAEQTVQVDSPVWFGRIAGLAMDEAERREQFQKLLQQDPLQAERLTDLFFRPLQDDTSPFAHQQLLVSDMAAWAADHPDLFEQTVLERIQAKQTLRGLHLGLNLLKSQSEELTLLADALLEKHFEQVYMQPYDWIAATDWAF